MSTDSEVYYLRIKQQPDQYIAPQILAHRLLLEKGVKVPEVVAFEEKNPQLNRSFMLVREISGISLQKLKSRDKEGFKRIVADVLFEAGENLSRVSSIPVKGSGYIRTDLAGLRILEANFPTTASFLLHEFEQRVNGLESAGYKSYTSAEVDKFKELVNFFLNSSETHLANGDLMLDHIYVDKGRYTGIIDWGDVLADGRYYDLALFSAYYPQLLPYILDGYASRAGLEKDYMLKLTLTRIAVTVKRLYWIAKHIPENVYDHPFLRTVAADRKYLQAIV